MHKSIALAIGILSLHGNVYAATNSVLIPIERGLWRVSDDGQAKRTEFELVQAFYGAGMEGRLSPDGKKVAFMRGPNIWLLDSQSMECTQLTAFEDWDLEANGAQNTAIYGWTLDGKKLIFEAVMADWSGDGPAPKKLKITSTKPCKKIVADKAAPPPESLGMFYLYIAPAKLVPIKFDEQREPIFSDSVHTGAVKSPAGKESLFAQGSKLLIGKKEITLPGNPMRYWWITDKAVAAMTLNSEKNRFELWVVTLSNDKIHGPYSEPRAVVE